MAEPKTFLVDVEVIATLPSGQPYRRRTTVEVVAQTSTTARTLVNTTLRKLTAQQNILKAAIVIHGHRLKR